MSAPAAELPHRRVARVSGDGEQKKSRPGATQRPHRNYEVVTRSERGPMTCGRSDVICNISAPRRYSAQGPHPEGLPGVRRSVMLLAVRNASATRIVAPAGATDCDVAASGRAVTSA